MKSKEDHAIIFTFPPDKSFVCLIDRQGNQLLFDSHVRYCHASTTFEEAVSLPSTRGHMAFSEEEKWRDMYNYIFKYLCVTLKSDSTYGFLAEFSKN